MAVSQGNYQMGAVPGLTLRAWAYFMGSATPTLLKGSGVSSITRSASGVYLVNINPAMADINATVQVACTPYIFPTASSNISANVVSTTQVQITTTFSSAAADMAVPIFVAIYG